MLTVFPMAKEGIPINKEIIVWARTRANPLCVTKYRRRFAV